MKAPTQPGLSDGFAPAMVYSRVFLPEKLLYIGAFQLHAFSFLGDVHASGAVTASRKYEQ
jgi:hypothetical protein